MRDTVSCCYGAERFLLLHNTVNDYRPVLSENSIVRVFRPWLAVLDKRRVAALSSFILRQKVLHLEIQFARRSKDEVENWRQRSRNPSVPHDVRLLSATLDGLVVSRPEPTEEQPQHLCLDAAYDSTPVYQELLVRHYQPHVRSRGEEKRDKEIIPGYRARRWVVERSHAWLNRSRRLLVRWEKKLENYLAFLHLACAQPICAKVSVFA